METNQSLPDSRSEMCAGLKIRMDPCKPPHSPGDPEILSRTDACLCVNSKCCVCLGCVQLHNDVGYSRMYLQSKSLGLRAIGEEMIFHFFSCSVYLQRGP